MTEEQVVNVRGEDSSSCGDHGGSVKDNGVARCVGGDLDLGSDGSYAAPEKVTLPAAVDFVSRESELKSVDSENGAGSVRNGVVESEIRDESANAAAAEEEEELVTDHEGYVVVGASDVRDGVPTAGENCGDDNANVDGVEECEILDREEASEGENGVVVTVVEGDADVNQSDREFECVDDVHSDVAVDSAVEVVTAATTDENSGNNVLGRSGVIFDKDVDKSGEYENFVGVDVSDEKDVVTNGNHDVEDLIEKTEVPVDVDGISATTDVKECEPEDAQNSLEKRQVESISAVAEPEPEPSECTKENDTAVECEPGSMLERSEEEPGSELVPEAENLTALNSTDVIGDSDVVSDIVLESKDEPSVNFHEMKSKSVDSNGEHDVDVHELQNGVVESEAEPSNGAVQTENKPSLVFEMKKTTEESEAKPSNGAIETEAKLSNGAIEGEAEPSNSVVESEIEPSTGAVESKTEPVESKTEPVESETEPSNGAAESETEPSTNGAVESEAEHSNDAVEREAEPSNGAVEMEAEPSNCAIGREAEPSNGAVESEVELSNSVVESEAEPSNGVLEREAGPSNGAVEREAEHSNGAVESEVEPSNGVVESEAEPSNGVVEREVEPSNGAVECEAEPSNRAVESEAKSSNGAVESEAKPSNGAVESETKPSNGAVESESEPSVVCEVKNNAVNSEVEPSSSALQTESESSIVSEKKNNEVESEVLPAVDLSEKKTVAVEKEAEPSSESGHSVQGEGNNQGDEDSRPASDALDGQNVGSEVVKKPFYYLIRIPRYDDDENIKEQIVNALHQVEEKTKIRDAIRAESQSIKASYKDFDQEFKAAIVAHRAARDLLKSKRQEIDSVQSIMNRLNNAISVGDIDDKIRNLEHMIQHETLPLNEEKQLIRQIKQLKQNREELSSNMRKQDQSQQSLDHRDDNIEDHFKHLQLLKKEMEVLRNNVLKSDAATKGAKLKYSDEYDKLNKVQARFKAADDIRQEAYAKLLTLKKQLHEKSKNFWEYRNAANKAMELAAGGKKEELQCFCVDQVERIMELWNKNDEFRSDYIRCNTRSTLRRLQTLDGRSLGPDEEPPVIPNVVTDRASNKNISMVSQSTVEQEKKSTPTESAGIKNDEPVPKVVVQRTEATQTTKAKKPTKPAPPVKSMARWGDESDEDEDKREEPVKTKEEQELILKAEKTRKEKEEAMLKEKRRQEEIEKAKEALQRKKRNAEKAQQRAALKAQKEAEQKEKEREKRARKKERRNATSAVTVENTEQESAPTSETLSSIEAFDQSDKPAEVTKKPQKPSQFTRQTKAKSVPLALRNRGKRRIQPWMWILLAVLVVVALFYVGNISSLISSLEGFGF